jgi:hypothetical protein
VDRLSDLTDEVGDGRANRPDDVLAVKTTLRDLGRLEEPKPGFAGLIDRPFDGAIRGFQRDKELRGAASRSPAARPPGP